jgi:adenosylcobinamide-GDP ribazoletransferase
MRNGSDVRQRVVQSCLHEARLFFTTLQFFTRAPIPRWVGFQPEWLGHTARYFPAVGIAVGAVAAIVYVVCSWFFPQLVAVLLSTLAGIVFTGALHEDGLTDAADGFGGGRTPERTLEIMIDSRVGSFGVIAIVLVLALKGAALSYLPILSVVGALLIGHSLSRLAATAMMWRLRYAKTEGKAMPLVQQMSTRDFAKASLPVVFVMLVAAAFTPISFVAIAVILLAVAVVTLWLAQTFDRRLGGYTGDCLGATQQLTELVCYLALLAAL